jgi:hypothetical protein
MKASNDRPSFPHHVSSDKSFNLEDLALIIGYKLTAYIGGAASIQSVFDWLREGLPVELESRMRTAFDVAKPIAEAESSLIAQGFLIRKWEELGLYGTPAQMLREADVQAARSVLTRMAEAEFLLNEAPNLEEIAGRLQRWIERAELPKGMVYSCQLWRSQRLLLTLVHSGFPEDVQRQWDAGIDWPCWNQIIAAVPEMASARLNIDLTTGCPFRYLRSKRLLKTKEKRAISEALDKSNQNPRTRRQQT